MVSKEDLLNVTLFAAKAEDEDWDISDNVGWSPDYQDPSTYLDILQTSNSEQTKTYMGYDDPSNPAVTQVGLKDYDKLLEEAGNETSDLNKRYEKYAAAQAWLTDSSLFLPAMSSSGAAPRLFLV